MTPKTLFDLFELATSRFQFIFYRYLGHYNVYMIDDYEDTCFVILVILTAIISKKSLVEINRY